MAGRTVDGPGTSRTWAAEPASSPVTCHRRSQPAGRERSCGSACSPRSPTAPRRAITGRGSRWRRPSPRDWSPSATTSRCSPPPTRARRRGCTPRPRAATRRIPASTPRCTRACTTRRRSSGPTSSTSCRNQFDFLPLTYSRLVSTPVVTTIHGFSSRADPAGLPRLRRHRPLRRDQRRRPAPGPDLRRDDPPRHRPRPLHLPRPEPGDYLLFLGRIHPDKGTHRAIEVARRAGLPLVIAGIIQDADYFRELVEPHLGTPGVTLRRRRSGPAKRDELLGGALALLHLIGFAEPFGLSVVESLATGTPVIAYPLGSMPEIIRPGRTGFLVDDVAAAVEAVGRVARAVAPALP